MEAVQTSSPFPHPWEESLVTCYSPLEKLETLDTTKKSSEISFSSANLLCKTGRIFQAS